MEFDLDDPRLGDIPVVIWTGVDIEVVRGDLQDKHLFDLRRMFILGEPDGPFGAITTPLDVNLVRQGEAVPSAESAVLDFIEFFDGAMSLVDITGRLEDLLGRVRLAQSQGWLVSTAVSGGACVVRAFAGEM